MGKRGAAGGAWREAALKLRSFGGKGEAEAALRELCKKGPPEEREIAKYELALLLHALGRHSEGDSLASELGCMPGPCNYLLTAA